MPVSSWPRLWGWSQHPRSMHHDQWLVESRRRLLPRFNGETPIVPAVPPADVTKISLRLRRLVEACVPCEVDRADITKSHSRIITSRVVNAAKAAADDKTRACVVFCLLVNKRWFTHQALLELWDAELHEARALACEVIAKNIIENEPDFRYLVHQVLLKRYSVATDYQVLVDSAPTPPCNAVEKAVDLHALYVICSSGYQKTMNQLWKGWLVQDDDDPNSFVDYADKDNTSFRKHLNPDRIRAPMYQNAAQMLISFLYLVLYTNAINSQQARGDFDPVEGTLYAFTLGFICDELAKLWKVGWQIVGFWNVLNFFLYALLSVSFVLRCIALSHGDGLGDGDDQLRLHFSKLSYNFLAVTAPLFWIRLLLYLDTFRFFGAMLVVLKTMMAESLIFFGFYQSFIGLDYVDQVAEDSLFIIQSMANALMQSPDFAGFEKFQHPFGLALYYSFTFIVMVVLLNVLIALFGTAYSSVEENANNEYLAMVAKKTLLFVRAPDENVFIPPFNLIEMLCLVAPLEWWMNRGLYQRINDYVMAVIYSPLLVVSAYIETRMAVEIRAARARGDDDGNTVEEWEQMARELDFDADGWNSKVDRAKSNLEEEPAVLEVRQLRSEIAGLREMIEKLCKVAADGRKGNAE